ncbi:hypothetical protein Q1695_014105 [Nippostrongylus brasiliensis]|nr:hypothetical protein Q1695_014105 [Nippostrongylus brasiliensis]
MSEVSSSEEHLVIVDDEETAAVMNLLTARSSSSTNIYDSEAESTVNTSGIIPTVPSHFNNDPYVGVSSNLIRYVIEGYDEPEAARNYSLFGSAMASHSATQNHLFPEGVHTHGGTEDQSALDQAVAGNSAAQNNIFPEAVHAQGPPQDQSVFDRAVPRNLAAQNIILPGELHPYAAPEDHLGFDITLARNSAAQNNIFPEAVHSQGPPEDESLFDRAVAMNSAVQNNILSGGVHAHGAPEDHSVFDRTLARNSTAQINLLLEGVHTHRASEDHTMFDGAVASNLAAQNNIVTVRVDPHGAPEEHSVFDEAVARSSTSQNNILPEGADTHGALEDSSVFDRAVTRNSAAQNNIHLFPPICSNRTKSVEDIIASADTAVNVLHQVLEPSPIYKQHTPNYSQEPLPEYEQNNWRGYHTTTYRTLPHSVRAIPQNTPSTDHDFPKRWKLIEKRENGYRDIWMNVREVVDLTTHLLGDIPQLQYDRFIFSRVEVQTLEHAYQILLPKRFTAEVASHVARKFISYLRDRRVSVRINTRVTPNTSTSDSGSWM